VTVAVYALGTPRAAASRGGDVRARDLDQTRNVHGVHRFAATTHCQINNGLIRLTLGATGAAPALTVEAWRGAVTIGDTYVDTYADLYGGTTSTPAWLAMGVLTIDSPTVTALLTAVRLVAITAESLTLRLIAPAIRDAFVTLRRCSPMVWVQHGSTRPPFVDTDRRIRWTASPSPVGPSRAGRVEEPAPAIDGMSRFVAALDRVTTDTGAFSVTAASTISARLGAGVGAQREGTWPDQLHRQLGDVSRPRIVVS
jgi:hypothetical protein